MLYDWYEVMSDRPRFRSFALYMLFPFFLLFEFFLNFWFCFQIVSARRLLLKQTILNSDYKLEMLEYNLQYSACVSYLDSVFVIKMVVFCLYFNISISTSYFSRFAYLLFMIFNVKIHILNIQLKRKLVSHSKHSMYKNWIKINKE